MARIVFFSPRRLAVLWLVVAAAHATLVAADAVSIGSLTHLVGNGTGAGAADGTGTGPSGALLHGPNGCSFDSNGTLYFADTKNNAVRRVLPGTATVTTFAGALGQPGDQEATTGDAARLGSPFDVVFGPTGLGYVPDFAAHRIFTFTVTSTAVTRFLGTGLPGNADGAGTAAELNGPAAIAFHTANGTSDMFVVERGGNRVRKVTGAPPQTQHFAGSVTGEAGDAAGTGSAARFNGPVGLAVVQATGLLFVADSNNSKVKSITPAGVVATVAGDGVGGHVDGAGATARFLQPWGLALSANGTFLYIADKGNNVIRRMDTASFAVHTIVGNTVEGWSSAASSVQGQLGAPNWVCLLDTAAQQRLYITGDHSISFASAEELAPTTTVAANATTLAPTTTAAPTNASNTTAAAPTTTQAGATTTAPGGTTTAPNATLPPGFVTTEAPRDVSAAPGRPGAALVLAVAAIAAAAAAIAA